MMVLWFLSPGERRRKSVRGCIISSDLSVLNLKIVKKGDAELPGLTDDEKPRMRGPKRASKIRKLFALTKVRARGGGGIRIVRLNGLMSVVVFDRDIVTKSRPGLVLWLHVSLIIPGGRMSP